MTKTYKYNIDTISTAPAVAWALDPRSLPWIQEKKAQKIAAQNETVSIGMARIAIRNGCKYFIKVPKEHVDAAYQQIRSWDASLLDVGAKGISFYSDGKIFLQDEELYTMIKTFYS